MKHAIDSYEALLERFPQYVRHALLNDWRKWRKDKKFQAIVCDHVDHMTRGASPRTHRRPDYPAESSRRRRRSASRRTTIVFVFVVVTFPGGSPFGLRTFFATV